MIHIRLRTLSRSMAALMAAVLISLCPGQEAFAQAAHMALPAQAAPGSGAIFRPTPAAISNGTSLQPAALLISAPSLSSSLSLQAAPTVDPSRQTARLSAVPTALAASAAPAAPLSKAAAQEQKKLQKQLQKQADDVEQRADEQKLIDRVLKVSIALEKLETNGKVSDEELKTTADKVWTELGPRPAAAPDAKAEAAPQTQGPALAKPGELEPQKMNGPPAAPSPAPAPSRLSVIRSSIRSLIAAIAAPLGRAFERIAVPVNALTRRVPGPLVMLTSAAATIGLDHAARLLLPAVFAFTPAAGLWVGVALAGVLIPALVATRLSLARKADPALTPLLRYTDGLLGVLVGAAVVTALGVLGLDLASAFIGKMAIGTGLVDPAALMGIFAFMAALPILYGAGHTAWGLKNKVKTAPQSPLQVPFNLILISMLIEPMMRFAALAGITSGLVGWPLILASIAAYRLSIKFMTRMTAKTASAEPAQVSAEELQKQWRLDKVPGEATTPDREILRARTQALWWGNAVAFGGLGLLALHQLSASAALALLGASILGALPTMVPMILLSGFAAALFMRTHRVATGPYVETVRDLAARAGLPMPRVYAAATTGSPNAFAAGGLYHLSVVAVKGYITRLMTVPEMRGVMGHEMSHVKYRHILTLFGAIMMIQPFAVASSTLLQLAIAYWVPLLWIIAAMGLTRANERMADAGGAKLTEDPRGLATGLRKFALLSEGEKMPHREGTWLYRLLISHPDTLERVQTLARMIKKPQ